MYTNSIPENAVTVHSRQYNGRIRYHWRVHRHAGHCGGYSQTSYATEFLAYLAAADIARCGGYRLVARPEMQEQLVLHWIEEGRRRFVEGQPFGCCQNQWEEQGWAVAEAELDYELLEIMQEEVA